MLIKDFDLEKVQIFLKYLAKATSFREENSQVTPLLSNKIKGLSKRLDRFIDLQENQRLSKINEKTNNKLNIKTTLENDFARIKKLLIIAKENKTDPEKLFNLIERAENIKKRINKL